MNTRLRNLLRAEWLLIRRGSTPRLGDFSRVARPQTTDATVLFQHLVPHGTEESGTVLPDFTEIWKRLVEEAARQPAQGGLTRGARLRVNELEGQLYYRLVRALRPQTIVETGVASGFSTEILLSGIESNGLGRLISVDITPNVGTLVREHHRKNWKLEILSARHPRRHFQDLLASLQPIDVFIHDSDHRYNWARFEYEIAWSALRPGGLLLSDDVDASFAWLDFCARRRLNSGILVGSEKLLGTAVRPETL
jgi:predicted O-methyltransferase YrrM